MRSSTRPILVTGGAGFIGCNLADRLAREGHHVLIYDSLGRPGVERNLAWLEERHRSRVSSVIADIRDESSLVEAAMQARAVFHFAAQVAVTTSLMDPMGDFEVNVGGTITLLEALRASERRIPVIFASTNKVYGDLADLELELVDGAYAPADPLVRASGVGESRSLDFHTPYGCSKGTADQYVLDYARSFGLPTCVLRMSCIYGPRQMGGEDQGWVAHFLIRALAGEPITIYGDGRQVRDVLYVADAVEAYLQAWRRIEQVSGRAFNLGGGPANAVSLRQVIGQIEALLGMPVEVDYGDWRAGDQRWFVADASAARSALQLAAPLDWRAGLEQLADWLSRDRSPRRSRAKPPIEAAA
jgi:CDP-paratose 2-epimerase